MRYFVVSESACSFLFFQNSTAGCTLGAGGKTGFSTCCGNLGNINNSVYVRFADGVYFNFVAADIQRCRDDISLACKSRKFNIAVKIGIDFKRYGSDQTCGINSRRRIGGKYSRH